MDFLSSVTFGFCLHLTGLQQRRLKWLSQEVDQVCPDKVSIVANPPEVAAFPHAATSVEASLDHLKWLLNVFLLWCIRFPTAPTGL